MSLFSSNPYIQPLQEGQTIRIDGLVPVSVLVYEDASLHREVKIECEDASLRSQVEINNDNKCLFVEGCWYKIQNSSFQNAVGNGIAAASNGGVASVNVNGFSMRTSFKQGWIIILRVPVGTKVQHYAVGNYEFFPLELEDS